MNTTAIPPAPLTIEPPKRQWLPYALAALALIVGLGIGTTLTSEPAAPAAQVERVTTTVEVPTAAPACLDVITHANRVMGLFRQGMNISADAMTAIGVLDLQQGEALIDRLDALSPTMGAAADDYWGSVEDCKAAR